MKNFGVTLACLLIIFFAVFFTTNSSSHISQDKIIELVEYFRTEHPFMLKYEAAEFVKEKYGRNAAARFTKYDRKISEIEYEKKLSEIREPILKDMP